MKSLWNPLRFFKKSPPAPAKLIALDGDGVLIDYHEGYALAWERAFGERPKIKDPNGYHPKNYWDVPELDFQGRLHLNEKGFTREVWRDMPVMAGAKEACDRLCEAGYELVCVTALNARYQKDRRHNLQKLGINVKAVYTAGNAGLGNPKATIIKKLSPVAFVDDYLPYLQGIPKSTWCALIKGRPNNSPNALPNLKPPDSTHDTLMEFADFWLSEKNRA